MRLLSSLSATCCDQRHNYQLLMLEPRTQISQHLANASLQSPTVLSAQCPLNATSSELGAAPLPPPVIHPSFHSLETEMSKGSLIDKDSIHSLSWDTTLRGQYPLFPHTNLPIPSLQLLCCSGQELIHMSQEFSTSTGKAPKAKLNLLPLPHP